MVNPTISRNLQKLLIGEQGPATDYMYINFLY